MLVALPILVGLIIFLSLLFVKVDGERVDIGAIVGFVMAFCLPLMLIGGVVGWLLGSRRRKQK